MANKGTEEFSIINNWLGWGEPENGLWFIGVEEGSPWKCNTPQEINESKKRIIINFNKTHTPYATKEERGNTKWPVAVVTAKISSLVSKGGFSWQKYRDDILWLNNSKVFNGNLLSLGKPSLESSSWPGGYKELFGFTEYEYNLYYENVRAVRYKNLQEFLKNKKPQAIVCFGMSHWDEFEKVFVNNHQNSTEHSDKKTKVFDKDHIILTRHFSNGMPDSTVEFIAKQLRKWQVSLK